MMKSLTILALLFFSKAQSPDNEDKIGVPPSQMNILAPLINNYISALSQSNPNAYASITQAIGGSKFPATFALSDVSNFLNAAPTGSGFLNSVESQDIEASYDSDSYLGDKIDQDDNITDNPDSVFNSETDSNNSSEIGSAVNSDIDTDIDSSEKLDNEADDGIETVTDSDSVDDAENNSGNTTHITENIISTFNTTLENTNRNSTNSMSKSLSNSTSCGSYNFVKLSVTGIPVIGFIISLI
ncbi:hypothetical protein AYI70_g7608 [Smittium culicis]|uniref:Uncharacterized protein n=1 Tax=Smittium culicis TaxID=133412 RepID=A0A1R1XJY7_9FUNG|nr:hypothetical protein AYI70_g7608 [Smittium culicis]